MTAGRALGVEQVMAEVMASGSREPPSVPLRAASPGSPLEPLTRREREVARLLAQGYTDRQVAAALTIAVSTAGVHVHHILEKLGLRSRWQIAGWAAEHDLIAPSLDERRAGGPYHGTARAAASPDTEQTVDPSGRSQPQRACRPR